MKQVLGWLVRVAIAVGIVAWVLSSVGIESVFTQLRGVRASALGLVMLFLVLEGLAKVANWRQMLAAMLGREVAYLPLLQCNLAGCFLGTAVPTSAGTDAFRAVFARNYFGGHIVVHAASMVAQNLFNWFAGALLGLGILAWLWPTHGGQLTLQFVALLLLGVATAVPSLYYLLKWRRQWLVLALRRLGRRWFKVRHAFRRFVDALLIFGEAHVSVFGVVLISMIGVTFHALSWMAAAHGLGVSLPLICWILMVPVNGLANIVPLSFAGFGFNQAVHLAVLGAFGVAPAEAVAVSALMMLACTTYNLVFGGIAFAAAERLKLRRDM